MFGAISAGLGLLGGIAGAQGNNQSVTSSVNLAPQSELEKTIGAAMPGQYTDFSKLVGAGAGQQDVTNALNSQRGLAGMLQQYANGGFLPSAADNATAQQFASSQFQPQQVAMQQQFAGQQQRAAQLASQLGRPVNDPIIQAKLSQEYMQGQERLGAAQGAFASQFAQSLPQQRLGYTTQLADVQNSLASQAMANRQALLGLGSQLQGQERDWRLGTASRTNSMSSGGGLGGAISGALAGVGTGFGAMGAFQQLQGNQMALNNMQQGGAMATPSRQGLMPMPSMGSVAAAPRQPAMPSFAISQAVPPAFQQGNSWTGLQPLGQGLPNFMQSAFNMPNAATVPFWQR